MAEYRQSQSQQSRVTVDQFLAVGRERLGMELVAGRAGLQRVIIEPVAHRPGLALSGFYRHFARKRIQVVGMAEFEYLSSMPEELRAQRLEELFAKKIPCMVFTRGKRVFPEVVRLAERDGVCVLRSSMVTRHFIHSATFVLEDLHAPRCKVHGTMLEVAGVGVFIEGAAGLGKSETALGLIKRGHALVADDLTQFRRDSSNSLLGSAMPVTQYYMEIRGIGIIDVQAIFGIRSIRAQKRVEVEVNLREWDSKEDYERLGLQDQLSTILDVQIPLVVIPIFPGKNITVISETIALNYLVKAYGYNPAEHFSDNLVQLLRRKANLEILAKDDLE